MIHAGEKLRGRVAVITGASSGIGEASARLFAAHGAHVVAVDVNESRGAAVVNEITQAGGSASFFRADLTREEECRRVIDETRERQGRLDILFTNAGAFVGKLLHESSNDDFDRVFDINVRSVFWLSKYAIPHMLEAGRGVICMTASKTGLVAQYGSPLYCASKSAVVRLMQAIALDYATAGIRANAICPGIIDTPMLTAAVDQTPDPAATRKWNEQAQPLGRLGTPAECADAALYLCSDDASFITGVALPVDGGFTAM